MWELCCGVILRSLVPFFMKPDLGPPFVMDAKHRTPQPLHHYILQFEIITPSPHI